MAISNRRRLGILAFVVILLGLGIWQANKLGWFKNIISGAILKSTDSMYVVRYDSSLIDEIAGNAVFYGLRLQSDSLQLKMMQEDTRNLPPALFNVRVDTLRINGAKVQDIIATEQIAADLIEIVSPTLQIIETGQAKEVKYDKGDTLALYQKLIGNYKQINAKTIRVLNGKVQFVRGNAEPHFIINGVNFQIDNFQVNENRDYNNIIAYFVKDAVAKVNSITLNSENSTFNFQDIEYNAPKHLLRLGTLFQLDKISGEKFIDLQNTYFSGLSTNDFVYNHKFKADSLVTNGGVLSFYLGNNSGSPNKPTSADSSELTLDNDFLRQAEIRNILIGKTQVQIFDRARPSATPFILKDATLNASDLKVSQTGYSLQDIISGSRFSVASGGFTSTTKDGIYKLDIGPFSFDNTQNILRVESFNLTPLISRAQFVRNAKTQTDYMNIRVSNIVFNNADISSLLEKKVLIAESGSVTPRIDMYNDRTLPPDTRNKNDQSPHIAIQKMDLPLYVKQLKVLNGYIAYEERGAQTKQTGKVIFTNLNATINNITNMKDRLAQNPLMTLDATATFMGQARINTRWELPQNTTNGAFKISGTLGSFNATRLNSVTEPLAAASIREGRVQSIGFNMTGNNSGTRGTYNIKYSGMKVDLLKVDDGTGELQKRGLLSALANLAVRSNVDTRTEATKERDHTKSFFNLTWKSIFEGVKNAALIVNPSSNKDNKK